MLRAVEDHYRTQQRVTVASVVAARRVWALLDAADLTPSWLTLLARLVALVTGFQVLATRGVDSYVSAALLEQGIASDPLGLVVPEAFSGMASDGRSLEGLFAAPVIDAKQAIGRGAAVEDALAAGRSTLDMLTATTIQDTVRASVSAAVTARPSVEGYVRAVNLPSCARCVILAGRFYRYSDGFLRHPRCDCVMVPSTSELAEGLVTDPMAAFRAGGVTGLSAADHRAITDGADMAQVVNVRRQGAVYTAAGGQKFTREGTTRAGVAGRRSRGPRPMPETIYRLASDRAEAVALLKRYGYIR